MDHPRLTIIGRAEDDKSLDSATRQSPPVCVEQSMATLLSRIGRRRLPVAGKELSDVDGVEDVVRVAEFTGGLNAAFLGQDVFQFGFAQRFEDAGEPFA